MKKVDFPVGQKVKGYGVLNEYGEFEFTPEQTGSRAGQIKQLKQGDGYAISYSKKRVIIHLNIAKKDSLGMIKELMSKVSAVICTLKTYEL